MSQHFANQFLQGSNWGPKAVRSLAPGQNPMCGLSDSTMGNDKAAGSPLEGWGAALLTPDLSGYRYRVKNSGPCPWPATFKCISAFLSQTPPFGGFLGKEGYLSTPPSFPLPWPTGPQGCRSLETISVCWPVLFGGYGCNTGERVPLFASCWHRCSMYNKDLIFTFSLIPGPNWPPPHWIAQQEAGNQATHSAWVE